MTKTWEDHLAKMEARANAVTKLREVLGKLAGAASMCWTPRPKGVFDSTRASKFVDESYAELIVLMQELEVLAEMEHDGPFTVAFAVEAVLSKYRKLVNPETDTE